MTRKKHDPRVLAEIEAEAAAAAEPNGPTDRGREAADNPFSISGDPGPRERPNPWHQLPQEERDRAVADTANWRADVLASFDRAGFAVTADSWQHALEAIYADHPHLRDDPTTETDGWDAPLPLARRADPPPFPVDGFPEWLRSFVVAEAEATQTPVDMASMFALAALATAAGGRVQVEPVPGWIEGVNLFLAVAMEPGSRKSAVHRDTFAPLVEYEQLLVAQKQPDITEKALIRRIAEAFLAKAEKAAAAPPNGTNRAALEQEAKTAAKALDKLDVPAAPRLFTGDVTPEQLGTLLHENGGRMAVLSAEGGIFDTMAGRYSGGIPNLDVYLQGHAGDPIRIDRRRRSEFVDRPALTVGLAVQPFVLGKVARVSDFAGRGLLDRFLYAIPTGVVGYRVTDGLRCPRRSARRTTRTSAPSPHHSSCSPSRSPSICRARRRRGSRSGGRRSSRAADPMPTSATFRAGARSSTAPSLGSPASFTWPGRSVTTAGTNDRSATRR